MSVLLKIMELAEGLEPHLLITNQMLYQLSYASSRLYEQNIMLVLRSECCMLNL